MYCKKCGNELNSDDKFCNRCGAKTTSKSKVKNKGIIIIMLLCVTFIIGIIGYFNINKNNNIFTSFISNDSKYEDETNIIKPLLVSKINSDNEKEKQIANTQVIKATQQYNKQFTLDTTGAKFVTLTEGLLDCKFEENYKNRNIFYITTKSADGFVFLKMYTTDRFNYKVILNSNSTYELYAYLENGEIKYGSDLIKLKEGIDKKDNFSKSPVYETYKDLLTTAKHNPIEYFVVDINNDDVEEIVLISEEGDYDYNTFIYTFINNEAFMVGETNSKDSTFYKMKEGYLKQVYLHGGFQEVTHLYFEDSRFIVKTVSSRELTLEEEKNSDYEVGDELIKTYSVSNLEGLESLK